MFGNCFLGIPSLHDMPTHQCKCTYKTLQLYLLYANMLDGCTCTSSVDIAYTAKNEHSLICQCLGNQLPLSSSFPPSHPTPFPHHLYTISTFTSNSTPTFTSNSTPTPSLHHLHLPTHQIVGRECQLFSHFAILPLPKHTRPDDF